MYEDGAGRKVQRLDRLVELIRKRSSEGISRDWLQIIAERKLGLTPKKFESYLRLLGKTREIEIRGSKVFIREDK